MSQSSSERKSPNLIDAIANSGDLEAVIPQNLRASNPEGGKYLPDEIWIAIFEQVVDPDHAFQKHRYLLPLTLVSQGWSRLILQTPSLWTNISIEEGMEDMEATIQVLLSLSEGCRLSLSYAYTSQSARQVAHLLYPHIHRVASLNLLPGRNWSRTPQKDILVPNLVFPQLRFLNRLNVPTQVMVELMSNHPPFSHCADMINGFSQDLLFRSSGKQLVEVSLSTITEANLRRLIQEFTSLRTVSLLHGMEGPESWRFSVRDSSLGWEKLTCFYFPWAVTANLVRGCAATLVTLMIMIHRKYTPELVAVLSRIGTLQSLAVHFTWQLFEQESQHAQSLLPTGQSNLRKLEIRLDDQTLKAPDSPALIQPLIHLSTKLSSYKIQGTCRRIRKYSDIGHLPLLRDFNLQQEEFQHSESHGEHILRSQSLEEVSVDACTHTLNSLSSETALRLTLCAVKPNRTTRLPMIQLLGERWPMLETLRIKIFPKKSWQQPNLFISVPTIKHLCLMGRPTVTGVVGYMAQHPDAFPILQSLEIMSCPEWDILFIMLERRLLAQIRPLDKIVFFRAIRPSIRNSLAHLFIGRVISRPSNYELSMQGNIARFLDVTIPGCMECHLYLHNCSHPTYPNGDHPSAREKHPYPTSVNEVLATLQERYGDYNRLYEDWGPRFRERDCRTRREVVEISRYSTIL